MTAEVAEDILSGESAVVVHRVDHDGSGAYDGDTVSDLDPALPTEATDPALCGIVQVWQMDETPACGLDTGPPRPRRWWRRGAAGRWRAGARPSQHRDRQLTGTT